MVAGAVDADASVETPVALSEVDDDGLMDAASEQSAVTADSSGSGSSGMASALSAGDDDESNVKSGKKRRRKKLASSADDTSFTPASDSCAACCEPLRRVAHGLPVPQRQNSTLICRISGKVMSDSDPPLVLPNGNAYSQSALQKMASKSENFAIRDPRTGECFSLSDCKRAFIV